jgi:lipopolysaccharide biosynthesis glycosyltransferase
VVDDGDRSADGLPPIVCAIDDAFVLPLCVMATSLVSNCPEPAGLRLIVLHQELGAHSVATIGRHAERLGLPAELRRVPPAGPGYPIFGRWTPAHFLCLKVADAIPDEPVVLLLDADVLVLDDIRRLLRHDLAGAPLAAVRDPIQPTLRHARTALPGWRDLGLAAEREYFNSGVMLLDLDECRRVGVFSRADRFLVEHLDNVAYADQDPLNWAVDGRWVRLERRWNTFALSPLIRPTGYVHHAEAEIPLEVLLRDETDPAILHYATATKPWKAGYPDGRLADLYRGYLEPVADGTSGS